MLNKSNENHVENTNVSYKNEHDYSDIRHEF